MTIDKTNQSSEKANYEKGGKAFTGDETVKENPHPKDSKAAKDWEHGYQDAQKVRSNSNGPK